MIITFIIAFFLLVSLVANFYLARFFITAGKTILVMETTIEECLDQLDGSYQKVGRILLNPLASDDPEIVRIHKEIKSSHQQLLHVANRLTSNWNLKKE